MSLGSSESLTRGARPFNLGLRAAYRIPRREVSMTRLLLLATTLLLPTATAGLAQETGLLDGVGQGLFAVNVFGIRR